MVTNDTRTSKIEGFQEEEEGEESSEEDDESSTDTDITQLHVPLTTDSWNNNDDDDEDDDDSDDGSLRQLDNDIKKNNDQRVERITLYYSYGDFEPLKSGLTEVKVGLYISSKTSSRYGSVTDASRSYIVVASDG